MKHFTVLTIAAVLVCTAGLNAENIPNGGANENAIYDPNPNHLWNRLNETLFVRTAQDGKKYGFCELDILYWSRTTNLLVGVPHQRALAVLDEFITSHGETQIRDPLKHALLQRDLWALFDWTARPNFYNGRFAGEQHELQKRLAIVIRRLALTTNEIAALPDNYAQAGTNLALTDLPRGMFQINGNWVNVSVDGMDPTASLHVRFLGGRSVFLVMLHHPDGRSAAISYLRRLKSFSPMWLMASNSDPAVDIQPQLNPELPQFPKNTQWGLVRRMCVIDTDGRIQPTPVVESIQIRTYLKIPASGYRPTLFDRMPSVQQFQEFQMSRKSNGALISIPADGKGFFIFMAMGMDPFDWRDGGNTIPDSATFQNPILKTCAECHNGGGIASVNVFTRKFSGMPSAMPTQITDSSPERETTEVEDWKQQQFNWGLLQGLWMNQN